MTRRFLFILSLFVLAALLWWGFVATRPIPGIESKGGPESWLPWLSLTGSVISLLTGLVTLLLKLIEMRRDKRRRKKA